MEDNPKKSFWSNDKNIIIVILSLMVLLLGISLKNTTDMPNTIETSTNTVIAENINTNEIEDIKKQLDEANGKIRELETNNQELTNKLNSMPNVEDLQKQIDEKNQYILNLETQVGSLTAEKSQAEAQIGILQEQISAKSSSETSTTSSNSSSTKTTSYTVYVTDTGSKYHRSGCSYLRQSSHAIDKNSAVSQGYTPCSRCNP